MTEDTPRCLDIAVESIAARVREYKPGGALVSTHYRLCSPLAQPNRSSRWIVSERMRFAMDKYLLVRYRSHLYSL